MGDGKMTVGWAGYAAFTFCTICDILYVMYVLLRNVRFVQYVHFVQFVIPAEVLHCRLGENRVELAKEEQDSPASLYVAFDQRMPAHRQG